MKRWYVAITKPGHEHPEHFAARQLEAQQFEVCLPMTYYRDGTGRKNDPRARLRFKGYIFVAFDIAHNRHGIINNTRGIRSLICHNDEMRTPIALPDSRLDAKGGYHAGAIEKLRELEHDEWANAAMRNPLVELPELRPGATVRIVRDKQYEGQIGQLISTDGGTSIVLIGSFQVPVSVFDIVLTVAPTRKRYAA